MTTFILMTTSIVGEDISKLERMLASLERNYFSNDVSIKHYLLLQNVKNDVSTLNRFKFPSFTKVLCSPNVMSLSKARNVIFDEVYDDDVLKENCIVGFPDDDSWYLDGFLSGLAERMKKNNIDFLFCKYGSDAVKLNESYINADCGYKDLIFNASSNTIFISGSIVLEVGGFNENLGVGAKYNGGEDLEYSIRSYRKASNCKWINKRLVGHRDKISTMRGDYFVGSALALKVNAFYSLSSAYHFVRKLGIGMYLVAKGEMRFSKILDVVFRGI